MPYFENADRGTIHAGEPVHEMWLRPTIDDDRPRPIQPLRRDHAQLPAPGRRHHRQGIPAPDAAPAGRRRRLHPPGAFAGADGDDRNADDPAFASAPKRGDGDAPGAAR